MFVLHDHSSQCLPLASTVTVDAIGIDELILELTLETMIVSMGVIVELVVIFVKESDVDDDTEGAADHDAIAKTVESSTGGETLELVSTLKVNTNGRACMYLRTGMVAF